jgi:lipopolysaccharide biosynthesis protein
MVIQKGVALCDLRNKMDFWGQINDQKIKSTCETVEGKDKETVETLQSAFLKFKRNRQVSFVVETIDLVSVSIQSSLSTILPRQSSLER